MTATARKKARVPAKALMEELTLRVDDAAALLGLSRHGTYAAIREGHIPSIRIGRAIRVPTASLRSMLGIVESAKTP
jgi:excisionase family DNA binding protein